MNNQLILWSMMLLPWLTLFLMKRDDLKRFMPVGLLGAITSMIAAEAGISLKLWAIRETIFPLSLILPHRLGLAPVVTIWLFKFAYGKFWRYIAVDAILNLVYTFIFAPWLATRGIWANINGTYLSIYLIVTIDGLLLYIYQMWHENALVPAVKKPFSRKLQPAVSKPTFEDENNKNNR